MGRPQSKSPENVICHRWIRIRIRIRIRCNVPVTYYSPALIVGRGLMARRGLKICEKF